MGAVYDVTVKMKYKDAEAVAEATRNYIKETGDWIEWNLDKHPLDVDLDTLVKYVIMDSQFTVEEIKGGKEYNSGFDQSYGWEGVMLEWFEHIAPTLRNGSTLWIYPDEDYDKVVVKNGEAVQVH